MCLFIRKPRVQFTIKLAGIPIEVNALYSQTKDFCKEYLSDDISDISISIYKKDIREERKRNSARCSNRYLETLALCRKVASALLEHGVVLFHGAAMVANGKAYLFTAKSGIGKTTHCKLWLKNIPECHILNGDKPLLLFKENQIYVCGSPWMGKENYGVNEILPLESICLLNRDEVNHIEKISLNDSFETMMNQCHIPEGNGNFAKVVNMIKQLSNMRYYRLGCNMKDEAAKVSYENMI